MDLVDAETSGRGDSLPGLFVCIYRPTMDELRQKKTTIIENELDKLRAQIASLENALEDKPDYGLGKGAPSVTRWELDRVLLQQLRGRVASLERALSSITGHKYGICEQCRRSIHPDRMAVLPDTKLCIRCARADKRY